MHTLHHRIRKQIDKETLSDLQAFLLLGSICVHESTRRKTLNRPSVYGMLPLSKTTALHSSGLQRLRDQLIFYWRNSIALQDICLIFPVRVKYKKKLVLICWRSTHYLPNFVSVLLVMSKQLWPVEAWKSIRPLMVCCGIWNQDVSSILTGLWLKTFLS